MSATYNGKGRATHKGEVGVLVDRLSPQDIEAERAVLGSILLDNDVLRDVMPILKPDHFYRDTHRILYRTICDIHDLGKAIDLVTLADELTRRDQFKAIGGDETLALIVDCVPHAANARYYADIVRRKSIGRDLIECASEILRDCYSNCYTVEQLLEAAEQRFNFVIRADEEIAKDLEWREIHRRYLLSDRWKYDVRPAAIERAVGRCQVCNSPDQLDVHHRTYERLGRERPADLTVLCRICHKLFHDNGRLADWPKATFAEPIDNGTF